MFVLGEIFALRGAAVGKHDRTIDAGFKPPSISNAPLKRLNSLATDLHRLTQTSETFLSVERLV